MLTFLKVFVSVFIFCEIFVSALMAIIAACAWFAFMGDPPDFPWFLWRLFSAVAFFLAIAVAVSCVFDQEDEE